MPVDPRLEQVLAAMAAAPKPVGTPAERREQIHQTQQQVAAALTPGADSVVEVTGVVIPSDGGGVRARVYRPCQGVLPGYVYFHGGGWWLGNLDLVDHIGRTRAVETGCVVVTVDYRLAPEHPFPAPLDDCWSAVRWVFDNADELGVDRHRIAVGGGSAGGNLAAAVCLLAREDGDVQIAAQVLEVPAVDLTLSTSAESLRLYGDGFGLDEADIVECMKFYVGGHDPKDPLVSPIYGDLHSLPPAMVTTAECDPLRDDGEAYAAKLQDAGVRVTLRRWDGHVHGSMDLASILPDAAQTYLEELNAFLHSTFVKVTQIERIGRSLTTAREQR